MYRALDVPACPAQSTARRWHQLLASKVDLPEAEFQAWRQQPEVVALEAAYRKTSAITPLGRHPGVVGSDVT